MDATVRSDVTQQADKGQLAKRVDSSAHNIIQKKVLQDGNNAVIFDTRNINATWPCQMRSTRIAH
jgi:hypothetical protein